MMSVKSVVFLAAFLYSTNCDDNFLPSYIHPCDLSKDDYADCIKQQISEALPHFTRGIPELGVPSTDPCDLKLTAKYKADGKILILPIQGDGDAVINVYGAEVIINSKLTHVKDHKGEHLKLVDPKYKYSIKKTTFEFENLFNGNKQLADATLQFANENWQQIMDDLAPSAIQQIVKTIVKAINKFLLNVTINQIFKNFEHILASRA
ncbi:Juvenile hormone binding protein, partial [Operophtera brumata]